MLKLGSSKPWQEAMEQLTGQREMDAGPLLNYFNPLYEWLLNDNKRTGELIGWESNKKSNSFAYNFIIISNSIQYSLKCHTKL